jgi:hypothetical protein
MVAVLARVLLVGYVMEDDDKGPRQPREEMDRWQLQELMEQLNGED